MKKVLAVALAVLMLAMTAIPAFADYYYVLSMEEDAYVEVPRYGSEAYVFVPEYSTCYGIYAYILEEDLDADPVIAVYDAYGNEIAYSDDYWEDGDLEALAEFYGYAGEEYYVYFSDAADKKATYGAYVFYNCGDYDYDGYCDVCWDLLCGCDCHQGGIVGFFWSIKNFFNMIFGLNEYCDCGAWHW